MIPHLNPDGYAQTRTKVAKVERRLVDLESRTDLEPAHLADIRHSYQTMIRKYRREILLFEAERSQRTEKRR